jgi:drug/metabolite transporter, DME family
MASARPAARGLPLVLSAAALWGTSGLVAALLYDRSALTPAAVGLARLALGAIVLAPTAVRLPRDALHGQRLSLLAVGAGLAGFQLCYFAAVAAMGVSLATLVTLGVAPLLVAVGSPALLGERRHDGPWGAWQRRWWASSSSSADRRPTVLPTRSAAWRSRRRRPRATRR